MKTLFLPIITLALLCLHLNAHAQCNRETIVDDYTLSYLGSAVSSSELGWTGDENACNAGTISALAHQRTLDRINYFRRLCGVPHSVTFDANKDSLCQEAALMMHANNRLSHTPDTSFICYTQGGDDAAGSANLALGAHSANAITLYMRDPGGGNVAVGHRRWVLYPRAGVFGHGSTSRASALWVLGSRANPPSPSFISYPAPGFFPAPLVFPRWSFSYPGADFSNARVTMTDPSGNTIPLNIVYTNGGYGDRSVVWEPDMSMISLNDSLDQTYHVVVSQINGASSISYEYDVTIIQPTHPPACALGNHWDNDSCTCIPDNTSIAGELSPDQVKLVYDRQASRVHISFQSIFLGNTSIQMIDMNGRVLEKRNWSNIQPGIESEMNLSHLPQGIYVIEVRQGNNRRILKIMK